MQSLVNRIFNYLKLINLNLLADNDAAAGNDDREVTELLFLEDVGIAT